MALTTPILQNIDAFDSHDEQIFKFYSSGGDQVYSNRLVIKNNADNSIVYEQVQTTFKFEHTLPSNTLTNGTQYNAQVFTRNINEDESEASNTILFYCFSIPIVTITNLGGGIINSSSYKFNGNYQQNEGEELESYIYYLYDNNEDLIAASSTKYDNLLEHTFSAFKDNYIYKINLKVTTVNGMTAESGIQTFSVNYTKPPISAVILLENIPDQGCIKINGDIINIEGISSSDSPIYINNEMLDLVSDGSVVNFDKGFNLEGDFTLKVWMKNPINRQTFLGLYNQNDTNDNPKRIELKYFDDRIDVYKTVGSQIYYIYSDTIITPNSDDVVFIWLQRKGNLLTVKAENLGNI